MSRLLLWRRGLVLTALVPGMIAGWAPAAIDPRRRAAGGVWNLGWPVS